ncbi:transporter [Sphingomonas sp.]|uniref:transporter n=1 Tax=Sphingomonas sp. TaxID=28214 RepID=UPI0035C82F62
MTIMGTPPIRLALILTPALLLAALPAAAQDAPLCSDRPGKATPSCVVAPGTVQVETSAVDWTRDEAGGVRSDTLLFADTLLRYGVGGDTEVRVGFTPYVRARTHTGAGGTRSVSVDDGFGDVGLSLKHRFVDGGDRGVSIAALPFVILPVGSDAVSAGTVSAGLTLPVDIPLPGGWSLNATPTIAAAADGDGDGRHLTYGNVLALSHSLTTNLGATAEFFVQRDRDPAGHSTQATADFLLAWSPLANWQFDVSTYVGLNRTTPDVELIGGFTRRF